MKDISARELKGHNILAVERFKDSTRWMIEFVVLHTPFAEGGTAFLRRTFLRFFFLSVSLSFACPYRII